jgi:beta-glucanase (GH16 family)
VHGYNFGSSTAVDVALGGNTLAAQTTDGSSSLAVRSTGGPVNSWVTDIAAAEFVPVASAEHAELFNQHFSVGHGGILIEQGVTAGTYQVYTYHMENLASHSRSFNILVEGSLVTAMPVSLERYHWVKMGPFEAVVADGVLDIALGYVAGDASIMGLEIYSTTGGRLQDLPPPEEPPDWTLVWSDEFDTPGLPDSSKWAYEEGYIRNAELQYYTRERLENARVEDGHLVIECRRDSWNGNEITSASLNTAGKRHFRYGRFEVRAKLPTGLGTWPAAWMLGVNMKDVGWPTCGEIDIMENVGYDPTRIHGTVHTDAYNHIDGTAVGGSIEMSQPWEDYHVYAVEWFSDRIDFFVDDQKYFSFANQGTHATWPFDEEAYLLINFAFGGSWGGAQGVNKDLLPLEYHIDYVRVYEQ